MYKYKIFIMLSIFSFPLFSMKIETETEELYPQIIKTKEENLTNYSYRDNQISAQASIEPVIGYHAELADFDKQKSQEYKNTKTALFVFNVLKTLYNPNSTVKSEDTKYLVQLEKPMTPTKPKKNIEIAIEKFFKNDQEKYLLAYLTYRTGFGSQNSPLPEDAPFVYEILSKLIPKVKKVTYSVIP